MKTLRQLIKKTKWKEVKKFLIFRYPDQKKNLDGYKRAFDEIKEIPIAKVDKNEYIIIERNIEDGIEWYSVSIRKKKDDTYYAVGFRSWKYISNLPIKRHNLFNTEIVAHCLWEMTYSGYSEKEVKKAGDKLFGKVKKIKK